MVITVMGIPTTLLMGISFGIFNFAILVFWVQRFSKYFQFENSKICLPAFLINMLVWIVGVSVLPYEWVNDNFKAFATPFAIYFGGSLLAMFITRLLK